MKNNILKNFWKSESGAVTVDWVVLTAAIVGLGFGVVALIAPNLKPVASGMEPVLQSASGLGADLLGGN